MNKKVYFLALYLFFKNFTYGQDNQQIGTYDIHCTYSIDGVQHTITNKQFQSIQSTKKDKKSDEIIQMRLIGQSCIALGLLKKFTPISFCTNLYYIKHSLKYLLLAQISYTNDIDIEQKQSMDQFQQDLAQQFSDAHFENIKLVQASRYIPKVALDPKAFAANQNSEIILNFPTINTIHGAYQKKARNQKLTQQEVNALNLYSWILLHESTHIRERDSIHNNRIELATITALECAHQWYRRKNPIVKTWKNLPLRSAKTAAIYGAMATITTTASLAYGRYIEQRADNFANTHGTEAQLLQAQYYFRDLISQTKGAHSILNTHPSNTDRITTIHTELDRRKQLQITNTK